MVFGGDRRDKDKDRGDGEGLDVGFLADLVRRAVDRSVQALLHSEEERKKLVGALMPRELLSSVLQTVDSTKREAVAIIGREMQQFLSTLNIGEELTKILTSVSFEIRTEVRFVPNEDGTLRSQVRATARPSRAKAAKARGKGKSAVRAETEPRASNTERVRAAAEMSRGAARAASEATRDTVRRVVDRLAEKTVEMAGGASVPPDERRPEPGRTATAKPAAVRPEPARSDVGKSAATKPEAAQAGAPKARARKAPTHRATPKKPQPGKPEPK